MEMARREVAGEVGLSREYRKRADKIYERLPIKERERAFCRLHEELFHSLDISVTVGEVLDDFPVFCDRIQLVAVSRVLRRGDEEADLNSGKDVIGIKIRSERLLHSEAAKRFLRHELMHVQDMLEERFEYDPAVGFGESLPGMIELVRNRYRLLWDIFIDARLERRDRPSIADWARRRAEFDAMYLKLPVEERAAKFDDLWQRDDLTHQELMALAQSPDLSGRAGLAGEAGATDTLFDQPRPGSLCPLCGFTTYHWATDTDTLPEAVLKGLRDDFPDWRPEKGACEHCLEAYKVQAGCW